jgi:excisionase family DNA binding protein
MRVDTEVRVTEETLSPLQAARRLNLSRERVIQLANTGELKALWTPLGRLFRVEDVERLSAERNARAAERAALTNAR